MAGHSNSRLRQSVHVRVCARARECREHVRDGLIARARARAGTHASARGGCRSSRILEMVSGWVRDMQVARRPSHFFSVRSPRPAQSTKRRHPQATSSQLDSLQGAEFRHLEHLILGLGQTHKFEKVGAHACACVRERLQSCGPAFLLPCIRAGGHAFVHACMRACVRNAEAHIEQMHAGQKLHAVIMRVGRTDGGTTGRTGRTGRTDGREGRTDGRTGRTDGREGRTDGTNGWTDRTTAGIRPSICEMPRHTLDRCTHVCACA